MFSKMDEVKAPKFHAGQTVTILCSGKWTNTLITRIAFSETKQGRKTFWLWAYHVTVDGVGIMRREDEIKEAA